jgi:hypothetical protein
MKRADTLKGRVLRELRGRTLPVSTGDLAALCAFGMRRAAQQTHSVLRRMEAVGVVTRFPPVVSGEGRPAFRWALTVNVKTERSAAA